MVTNFYLRINSIIFLCLFSPLTSYRPSLSSHLSLIIVTEPINIPRNFLLSLNIFILSYFHPSFEKWQMQEISFSLSLTHWIYFYKMCLLLIRLFINLLYLFQHLIIRKFIYLLIELWKKISNYISEITKEN